MSERHREDNESRAYGHLNSLFEELYLSGMPKGNAEYRHWIIANASKQYLQAIGVEKFPSAGYVDDDIAGYIDAHMNPIHQPAELRGMVDNTSHVLGVVIGTAWFHPDSTLSREQKEFLLGQSVGALKRVQHIEPGHPRSDAKLFAWMFSQCMEDYYPSEDGWEVKNRILMRFEDQAPVMRGRLRRWGRNTLDALADYPGPTAVPPHLRGKGSRRRRRRDEDS